jgi:cytochrome c oxidase assembly factor CtaG
MVMWAWQYPPLLDWTLQFNVPYTIGTLLAMVTAIFLWWPVYAPGRLTVAKGKKSQGARQLLSPAIEGPLNPEAQMIYWFLNFDLMMPPTIYVIDTSSPFYTVYQSMPHLFGLSSLADQQLGGLIMGVSMAIAYAIAFARAFSHYDMSSWYA